MLASPFRSVCMRMSQVLGYIFEKHTHNTHSPSTLSPAPAERELREDLWVRGKDQEKCFLINYSKSLLGRVLHRTVWRITPSLSLSLSLPVSSSFFRSSITHSLSQCALILSVPLFCSSVPHFFVFCNAGPHAPREGPSSWASASCRW